MLHVVSLPIDKTAEVQNHTSGLVALAENGRVCVLESGEFLLVALTFSLELFSDVLLEDKCFESIVALLLRNAEALGEASGVVFLLLDERCEATILALMSLDLDFELLCLFGELFGESLEFEELPMPLIHSRESLSRDIGTCCFQLSSSSTRKLFLFVTLVSSPSILPLRLIKSCHASIASLEYWLRSRTISLRWRIETFVINGFFTEVPKIAFMPELRPCNSPLVYHLFFRRSLFNSPISRRHDP